MKPKKVIEVNNLTKAYYKNDGTTFNALNDVSFDLHGGEVLGVIGKNGSGKSTLLKILSGILKPTAGEIIIDGKISSILDIGTGFHPDITGRKNVYLSGSIYGLNKKRVDQIFDELLAFSEIEEFIDEPVKNYSSGMYMRLAFSIFAFMEPEILLLDEVFSVGDVAFQRKCISKLRELIKNGVSVIVVAHDMTEISTICNRVILLSDGKIIMDDTTNRVINYYLEFIHTDTFSKINQIKEFEKDQYSNGYIELTSSYVYALGKNLDENIYRDDAIVIELKYKQLKEASIQIMISIVNSNGEISLMDSYAIRKEYLPVENELGVFIQKIIIPKNLFNFGTYFINYSIATNYNPNKTGFEIFNVNSFKIKLREWDLSNRWSVEIDSHFRPNLTWELNKLE